MKCLLCVNSSVLDGLEVFSWFLQMRPNVLQLFFARCTHVFCAHRGHYCLATWLQLCNDGNIIIMIIMITVVIQTPDQKKSRALRHPAHVWFHVSPQSETIPRNSVRLFVLRMFSKWGSTCDVRWPPLRTSTRCYNILPTSLALG